nr:AbfB domain-containing protein [Stigmatella erecta]
MGKQRPGRYLRHFTSEVWIADGSGGGWNGNASFTTDVSWNVVAPWAP